MEVTKINVNGIEHFLQNLTNFDEVYTQEIVENDEWISVLLDSEDRIIEGMRKDGTKYNIGTQIDDSYISNIVDTRLESKNVLTKDSTLTLFDNRTRLFPITKLPCVSFTFDDGVANDRYVVDVFDFYGLTASFALVSNIVTQPRFKEYLEWNKRGYSIINHSVSGSPYQTTKLTLTAVDINDGVGTISCALNYGALDTTFKDMIGGTIHKSIGDGQEYITYTDYNRNGSVWVINVKDVTTLPKVGDTYTFEYPYEYAQRMLTEAKYTLEKYGLVVNTFAAPSSAMLEQYIPILENLHTACFLGYPNANQYDISSTPRVRLHRQTLQSKSLQELKKYIDDCIQHNSIITFIGHAGDLNLQSDSVDEWSIPKLKAVIEYCIEKRNNGELWIGNTDECIKYFFDL